jgi:cysteine desulfurase/selenocysteine lyase
VSLDKEVRALFPQLKQKVRGRPLVYLDSGATSLKPLSVIEAVRKCLSDETANVHRGAHYLSDLATERFEGVRQKAQKFLRAKDSREIIFTRGTTESMNLLATTLGKTRLEPGDEILLSQMEHHSNIVPWQMIAAEKKAVVRFAPVSDDGSIDLEKFRSLLNSRTKIVSLGHVSNVLGTINPLATIFAEVRKRTPAVCVVDAAQSVSVMPLDVNLLGCDFLTFSGHKVFAPTGVGILYGKLELLETLPPYQGGGSMIREVREDGVDFLPPPQRFEAGTPAISDIMGLGAALDFVNELGLERIERHDRELLRFTEQSLSVVPGFKQYGTAPERCHVLSFLLDGVHPSDIGAILDEQGIAVRAGHHCCQPLMRRFGIPGTVRATISVYTNEEDIALLSEGVKKAQEMLR